MKTCQEIWQEIASDLRDKLGADRYERWLAPLRVVRETEAEVLLGVPNRFWLEWIEKKYLGEITGAFRRGLDRSVRVSLGIDPELFRKLRRNQEEVLAGVVPGRTDAFRGALLQDAPEPADGSGAVPPSGKPAIRALERQTLDEFVVGASNRMAHAAAAQVVEAPGAVYNPLFIYSASGLGKTHLLRGICHGIRKRHPHRTVRHLTGEQFLNRFLASLKNGTTGHFRDHHRAPQVLLFDDIQLLGNKHRTQEEFLHTFNALVDTGCQVVIASDCHPKNMGNVQRPLVGRFLSGLTVAIGRPEFETRLAIVRQKSRYARLQFPEAVLQLLAEAVRTSARELIGAFNILEASSYHEGHPLNPDSARQLLYKHLGMEESRLTLPRITKLVARHFQVPLEALLSQRRHRSLSLARQVAMFLSRKYTDRSLAEIGKYFGNRNHSSVKLAAKKVEQLLESHPALAKDLEKIIDSFED